MNESIQIQIIIVMGEKGQLFLIEEFQLVHVEGMMERENCIR